MPLERTNYFYGQVLGCDDSAGAGVLSGEGAPAQPDAPRLRPRLGPRGSKGAGRRGDDRPRLRTDPYGEEILVEREVVVDLRTEDSEGNSVAACADDEESGARIAVERPQGKPLHIAIRYAECGVAPVPVESEGGDETVRYSRTRESFVMRVLRAARRLRDARRLPEPPTEPWVILADVALDSAFEIASIGFGSRRRVPRTAV